MSGPGSCRCASRFAGNRGRSRRHSGRNTSNSRRCRFFAPRPATAIWRAAANSRPGKSIDNVSVRQSALRYESYVFVIIKWRLHQIFLIASYPAPPSRENRSAHMKTRLAIVAWICLWTVSGDGKPAVRHSVITFQHGVNGYFGTVDTEIWALAPTTIMESNPNASSDANNDGGESQVLMRFDDIIGPAAGRIPHFATIHSAKLSVSAFDQGDTVNLHRMKVPFDR